MTLYTLQHAALFDLDGVLIDSESAYTVFWGEMGRKYIPDVPDFALKIKGSTLPRILDTYFPDMGIRDKVVKSLHEFEAAMTYDPFPGAIEFVSNLRGHGIPTAIVTSSGADKMAHLRGRQPKLLSLFDTIVTAADVSRSKPDPEGYLLGASRLGIAPSDCFVFEDSLSGLAAGKASGAHVIAIATTLPYATVSPFGDHTVNSLADLTADSLLELFN